MRRIQTLHKEADLNVDDRIRVTYRTDGSLAKAVDAFREFIMAETLAEAMEAGDSGQVYEIEGQTFEVGIERV